ncbi:MAG: ATP-binding cassette domain-containing protein [Hahellaceae bacterium]|nr:ATP-binding cassette domain-containing protein [Hahellaceae bacterium]
MLEVDQLVVERGPLLFNFHFTLPTHHILLVTGPSGAGKSTLLDTLAGFLRPRSGSIRWNRRAIHGLTPERRPVTSLFQANNLFEHLSIQQNLRLALGKNADADWMTALKALDLESHLDKVPGQLSGGQRQRVALITTVLRPEPLVLMDEPFSELDSLTRSRVIEWCQRQFVSGGKTVVLVSHHQDDIDQLKSLPHQLLSVSPTTLTSSGFKVSR